MPLADHRVGRGDEFDTETVVAFRAELGSPAWALLAVGAIRRRK